MELDNGNRIVIALGLCMVVYMLFMYNQMNSFKATCKTDNEGIMKRFEENEEMSESIHSHLKKLKMVPQPAEPEEE